jgi:dolichol kinase
MQFARKLFHMSGVFIPVLYLGTDLQRTHLAIALFAVAISLAILDTLRYRIDALQTFFKARLNLILDPKDLLGPNGSTLYFLGCGITVALFEREVACAGLFALMLGDPAAALVGRSIRSPKRGNVSVAGSLACFVVTFGATYPLLSWPRPILAALLGTVAEAVAGSRYDNLVIPIAVAGPLSLL